MKLIQLFFSPIVFCLGFLMPLAAQSILALNLVEQTTAAYGIGLAITLPFAVLATFKGSWLGVKS